MKAITFDQHGGPEVLRWAEVVEPNVNDADVLIEVAATALNRADLLQRQGHYPPPPGASEILGLECSGRIVEVGKNVRQWNVGDEVCALLAGGGYAERVAVPAQHVLPIPSSISLVDVAALPEVTCTVWSNVFMVGRLRSGETFLCHGGSGGVGTMAVQLAHRFDALVFTTVSSQGKRERCRALGADLAIDHNNDDFVEMVKNETEGRGADVILDNMGAAYLTRNIDALAQGGRLVVIGMQGGIRGELDFTSLMAKQGTVAGTALRTKSLDDKAAIVSAIRQEVWPMLDAGDVVPVIDRYLPIEQASDAHRLLESGKVIGKIVLTTGLG